MSPERLPSHDFRPIRLVAAAAFAALGVVALTDTALDRGIGWLWGTALVLLGVVGVAVTLDRVRDASRSSEPLGSVRD